jgi:peptide/nickel transport system substrate-binding protein
MVRRGSRGTGGVAISGGTDYRTADVFISDEVTKGASGPALIRRDVEAACVASRPRRRGAGDPIAGGGAVTDTEGVSMQPMTRRGLFAATGGLATLATLPPAARAQSRAKTLRFVTAGTVNSLDPMMLGATTAATGLSAMTYDRLVAFDKKPEGDIAVFDFDHVRGELAESFEVSPDGLTYSFHIRRGALWQDGTPVTSEDVKWSLDRAVSAATMSKAQAATGSLTGPDQVSITGDATVQITLAKADRLLLPNLASPYVPMYNGTLARQHATAQDPWALQWLTANTASSGAYSVESYVTGQHVILARNPYWKNGPAPWFERVIVQTVPEAATRSNLVARGDADITDAIQLQDLGRLEQDSKVTVSSTPMPTAFAALIFNTQMPPFDNKLVRQAIALALPYDQLFAASVLGHGGKLYGAAWTGTPPTASFPQPLPTTTNLDLARQKLAEAGFPQGFQTTLSYGVNRASFADPAATIIQEALGQIGITAAIEKLPDPQMAQAITDKRLPLLIERSLAMFPSTEYFFRIFLNGPARWNFSSWNNPEVNAILPQARYEPDQAKYDALARKLIGIMAEEMPMVMLWQPTLDVVMARDLQGLTVWCTYNTDARDLSRR